MDITHTCKVNQSVIRQETTTLQHNTNQCRDTHSLRGRAAHHRRSAGALIRRRNRTKQRKFANMEACAATQPCLHGTHNVQVTSCKCICWHSQQSSLDVQHSSQRGRRITAADVVARPTRLWCQEFLASLSKRGNHYNLSRHLSLCPKMQLQRQTDAYKRV